MSIAAADDFAAVGRMLELYYELSDIWDQDLDARGEYGYNLDEHVLAERFFAHVALINGSYAGFALVFSIIRKANAEPRRAIRLRAPCATSVFARSFQTVDDNRLDGAARRFQPESQVGHHLGPRRNSGGERADINRAWFNVIKACQTCFVDNKAAFSSLPSINQHPDWNCFRADADNPGNRIVRQLKRRRHRVGSLTRLCLVCRQLDPAFLHKIHVVYGRVF